MIDAIRRNTALFLGMAACGFLCVQAKPFMLSRHGSWGPALLQSEAPVAALLALVVVLALATAVAVIVGRVINTAVGLFVLGTGLFVLALRLGTAGDLASMDGSLPLMALETVLVSGLVLGAAAAMFRFSGPLADVHPEEGEAPEPVLSTSGLTLVAAGLLVIPAVWLIARSPLKGQVIGAVFVGSMVAALAGRLLRPHVQPVLLFAAPVLFGGLAQLAVAMISRGQLIDLYFEGGLSALLRPMPIDYAAGSLMGVAVGLGWARSFLHHEDDEPADAGAALAAKAESES